MGIEEFDEDAWFAKVKPEDVIEDFGALDNPPEELTNNKGDDEDE